MLLHVEGKEYLFQEKNAAEPGRGGGGSLSLG